jgi:hypothetical protein
MIILNPAEFQFPDDQLYRMTYYEPTLGLYFQHNKVRQETLDALKIYNFQNDKGVSIQWTPGQLEIIDCILWRASPNDLKRIEIIASTQYGKSLAVAAGVVIRASIYAEKWAIVAGTTEKAKIIMEYVIMLALDNKIVRGQLDPETSLDRLRMKKSTDRLSFRKHGEVRVYSAEAKLQKETSKALMGFGSPNIIEDESALIGDILQATVMRMMGGSADNFLVKIGNPFNRGHFLKTWQRGDYYRIFIDYHRALDEGRYTQDFINEMLLEAMFDILYECKFPGEGAVDVKGWIPLLTEEEVRRAFTDDMVPFGIKKQGNDVAGGGRNYSVSVQRTMNLMQIKYKEHEPDTMVFASKVIELARGHGVTRQNNRTDEVGVGKGASDHIFGEGRGLPVNAGWEPTDKTRYVNKRAEMYWRFRTWVLAGGKFERNEDWLQLADVKYKVADGSGKIKIMSKEEMLANGVDSPDVADAGSFTFFDTDLTMLIVEQQNAASTEVAVEDNDPYGRR